MDIVTTDSTSSTMGCMDLVVSVNTNGNINANVNRNIHGNGNMGNYSEGVSGYLSPSSSQPHLTMALAEYGGMPAAAEKQAAGVEAIMLARRALEIHTRLHGVESFVVANDLVLLAGALDSRTTSMTTRSLVFTSKRKPCLLKCKAICLRT